MKRIGSFVVFFVSFLLANAKLIPIVYEDIEFCAKEGEDAKMFDYSHLEIFAESDTKVYLNGSWIVLKEIKSPWKVTFFAEKYIRSQWNMEMFNKKIPDFCKVIQSPLELWYHVTSKFNHKNCPFPAGVRFSLNLNNFSLTIFSTDGDQVRQAVNDRSSYDVPQQHGWQLAIKFYRRF